MDSNRSPPRKGLNLKELQFLADEVSDDDFYADVEPLNFSESDDDDIEPLSSIGVKRIIRSHNIYPNKEINNAQNICLNEVIKVLEEEFINDEKDEESLSELEKDDEEMSADLENLFGENISEDDGLKILTIYKKKRAYYLKKNKLIFNRPTFYEDRQCRSDFSKQEIETDLTYVEFVFYILMKAGKSTLEELVNMFERYSDKTNLTKMDYEAVRQFLALHSNYFKLDTDKMYSNRRNGYRRHFVSIVHLVHNNKLDNGWTPVKKIEDLIRFLPCAQDVNDRIKDDYFWTTDPLIRLIENKEKLKEVPNRFQLHAIETMFRKHKAIFDVAFDKEELMVRLTKEAYDVPTLWNSLLFNVINCIREDEDLDKSRATFTPMKVLMVQDDRLKCMPITATEQSLSAIYILDEEDRKIGKIYERGEKFFTECCPIYGKNPLYDLKVLRVIRIREDEKLKVMKKKRLEFIRKLRNKELYKIQHMTPSEKAIHSVEMSVVSHMQTLGKFTAAQLRESLAGDSNMKKYTVSDKIFEQLVCSLKLKAYLNQLPSNDREPYYCLYGNYLSANGIYLPYNINLTLVGR